MLFVAPALLGLALGAASHLDQGQEALRGLDYQKAESELQLARSEPGLSRTDLLRLLECYGAVEAVLGNHDSSIAAFRELLNLDPAHVAPTKWAPKVRTPFFEAKSWQSEHAPLDLKEGAPVASGGTVTALQFELTADPLGLARSLRVHLVGVPTPLDTKVLGPGTLRVTLAAQASLQYWAELVDEHGATLVAIGDGGHPQHVLQANPSSVALAPEASLQASSDTGGNDTMRTVGLAVGGAGVVALAVGAVFGIKVHSDQNALSGATRDSSDNITSLTRAQAISLDHEAKTDAVVADVLFAAGGVAAATGVGLWLGGTFLTAAPVPESKGAGVAVSMSWP